MKRKHFILLISIGTYCLAVGIGIIISYYMARPNPNIEVPDENIEERILLQKKSDLIDQKGDCFLIV
jgi:hypothetical protein